MKPTDVIAETFDADNPPTALPEEEPTEEELAEARAIVAKVYGK